MLVSTPVAQDRGAPASPLVDRLARCLEIRTDVERLACTDVAARALVDASRRKDIVVVDKEAMRTTRRSLFGFSLPRIGLFGSNGPDDVDEVESVELRIKGVSILGYGKLAFTLDDGSRWSTTEAWSNGIAPTPGAMLTVRKGALGSYFVKSGGSRGVRAMRTG